MNETKFKMTELGLIPEEWEVRKFDKVFKILSNNTYSREYMTYDITGIYNIHYGDILVKYNSFVDIKNDNVPCLKSGVAINELTQKAKSGDIIIADTAEDITAGKTVEIYNAEDCMVSAGLHTYLCSPKVDFSPKFLGYYMNGALFHNMLIPYMTGTKVTSISKGALLKTSVTIPTLAEQAAIAAALTDIDDLISTLKKLIKKKRDIKQGAMQELLSGKRRLEGFEEPWVEKELGEVGKIIRGVSYKPEETSPHPTINHIALLRSNNIFLDALNYNDLVYVSTSNVREDQYLKIGDILICMANGSKDLVGKNAPVISPVKCTFGAFMSIFRPYNIEEGDFLAHLLHSDIYKSLLTEAFTGSAINNLKPSTIERMRFFIPSELNERLAIAVVLSDMDSEIAALEAKLAKYEDLKQGMMQQLLTGKIRLV